MLPDPYDPQQLNRYAYVRNNPVKFVDPSGNFGITVSIIAGTAIVGVGILVYPTVKDYVTTAITDMYEGSVEASNHINDIQKNTEKTLINTGLILTAKALINQMFDQSLTPSVHSSDELNILPDIYDGTGIKGFTNHGWEQAQSRDGGRGVTDKAIVDALNNPISPVIEEVDDQGRKSLKYIGESAEVVLDESGEWVVTVIGKNKSAQRNPK